MLRMVRMAKRLVELPPAFLAANAYARMTKHSHKLLLRAHTHIRNYIWRWSWLLWLLEKSFIENDEHAHNPTNGLAIYISICVYVCVCVCVSRSLLVF